MTVTYLNDASTVSQTITGTYNFAVDNGQAT